MRTRLLYRSLLQELDSGMAAVALRSFTDAVIASRLQFSLPARQWPRMLERIGSKLTGRSDRPPVRDPYGDGASGPDRAHIGTGIVPGIPPGSRVRNGPGPSGRTC